MRWTSDGLEVAEREPGPLAAGWVRLRVGACGLCGTDVHLYRRDREPRTGGVPGHEIAGVPVDGPAGVPEALHAVEPRVWCGVCAFCRAGRRHLCVRGEILGVDRDGGLAELVDVPREALHPLPPAVDPVLASLAEPLAVALRAVRRARVEAESRVLVLGAGSIGLLCGLLAREGAREVAVTARYAHQREAARDLGLVPLDEASAEAWAAGASPDVVLETVGGRADTLRLATLLCRPAGRVVVLGLFDAEATVSAFELVTRELTVLGSNTYGAEGGESEFREACALVLPLARELRRLQTHRFPLAHAADALETAADKTRGALKVTVVP